MKIPNAPTGTGYYNNQEANIIAYLSDNSDSNSDGDSPAQRDDFSEYLWMENEEEFDSQVMKQLEEEALMEQCIEAMLEDERDPSGTPSSASEPQQQQQQQQQSQGGPAARQWSTGDGGPSLCESVESLTVSDDLAKGSKLNPNATEFVPRQPAAQPIESNA